MDASPSWIFARRTPREFVCEVDRFRDLLRDEQTPLASKEVAWSRIVRHAAELDAHDAGFAGAGLALKDALCAWLDLRARHSAA
ncbi:MAG TPA: hypothetical protein VMV45_16360 [Casimicrobiaceae bacterium]|nr:hypothetical protein [Casimicrobiaceae bacterium]